MVESSERVSVKENKDADLLTSSASKDTYPMTPHEHCPLIGLVGGLVSRSVPKLKGWICCATAVPECVVRGGHPKLALKRVVSDTFR